MANGQDIDYSEEKNGPRASTASLLGLFSIILKYFYIQQISGDHWSSGLLFLLQNKHRLWVLTINVLNKIQKNLQLWKNLYITWASFRNAICAKVYQSRPINVMVDTIFPSPYSVFYHGSFTVYSSEV